MRLGKSIFSLLIIIALSGLLLLTNCGSNKIEVSSEPRNSTIDKTPPTIKVFLENSGSMDGYMCDGSQLKDAMYAYLSDLKLCSSSLELNYINSKIIPFKGGLDSYIKELNPISFRTAGGNRSKTDLREIIKNVISNTNDTSISIFISDCILDLDNKNAQDFFTNCQISIKNSVISGRDSVPNFGVVVAKLTSKFTGKYFYPNSTVENLNDVTRPYYMWIFGNSNIIANILYNAPLDDLQKYGFEDMISFVTINDIPFDINNKTTTSKIINPTNGYYLATIRADFRTTLQPNNIIVTPLNYTFYDSSIAIETIQPITANNSEYTHYITIKIPQESKTIEEVLTFNSPRISNWVYNSNDDSGTDIKNNLSKTTGIKYLIDPAKVTRVALENAASIAGMFLTTECVIVEKKDDKADMPMGAPGMGGMGGMM